MSLDFKTNWEGLCTALKIKGQEDLWGSFSYNTREHSGLMRFCIQHDCQPELWSCVRLLKLSKPVSSGLRLEPKWLWHLIPQHAGADSAALPFSTPLNSSDFWRRRKLLQWISWSHLKGPGPITWVVWWIESKIDRSDDVTLNERPIALSVIIHYTVKFQFLPNQCNYWPSAGP